LGMGEKDMKAKCERGRKMAAEENGSKQTNLTDGGESHTPVHAYPMELPVGRTWMAADKEEPYGFRHGGLPGVPAVVVQPMAERYDGKVADEKLYLTALTMIDKVGPRTSRALLQHCGGAQRIFKMSRQKLARIPSVGEHIAHAIHGADLLLRAEKELRFAEKNGIQVVSWFDDCFPGKLKEVNDSPLVIYAKGKLPAPDRPHIAVVGTRKPTAYGKKMAKEFAAYFARRGIVVVSGLAFGIDMEAHSATLDVGGCTMAVLGHGLDQIYPREHAHKAQEMIDQGGALITEFCSGTQPDAFNFPARNRIISGLCDSVLVVEATEKGGALITAKMAFDQDRDVFAIPGCIGSATSVGCNQLIRDHVAKIACSPADVIDGLEHLIRYEADDGQLQKSKVMPQLSERELLVWNALSEGALHFDEMAERSGIPRIELGSVLLGMEFRQLVVSGLGNTYQLEA
jgi:DNA processing protein